MIPDALSTVLVAVYLILGAAGCAGFVWLGWNCWKGRP